MSIDLLLQNIIEKQNPSVAGLDPQLSYIPEPILNASQKKYGASFEGAADAILTYNKGLIDALCDIVPAVKPQSAFYELYGCPGETALHETMCYAKEKGMYVIADVKRNDIGNTAAAYAKAYLGETDVFGAKLRAYPADCATVNAYLGSDGITPFLAECEKGRMIFVLVKTSNPSSGEFQDRILDDGKTLFETVAQQVEAWGEPLRGTYGYSACGAVVGATYPEELCALRKKMPHTCFLVPGYGAQGGGAKDIVGAFDENGLGAIINSSRGILCAWQKTGNPDYQDAARKEALRMKEEILSVLGGKIG